MDWNPLLNGTHAMTLVIMAATWKQISYNFLFFLAGLQSIPKSVHEAAAIDGAKPLRRFWTVTFPLLSPTAFFLLVVNIVYVFFDTFGIIDAMTPQERTKPELIKASRKRRIATGAGVPVQAVNQLLNQFEQMQKMMKMMKGGNLQRMMRNMKGMLPGTR
jgi:ABC-type sugar transport system permease subunit